MKAWSLEQIGKIAFKENSETPVLGEDEVLVKVHACGICGSDIPRIYKNGAHRMPLILGHEFSGEVVDTGERVGVFPLIPCMKCEPCKNHQYEMCRNYNYLGSRCDGGFAEYVSVPRWNLIALPDGVSYEAAAMLEPMAVAVHAMRKLEAITGLDEDKKNNPVCIYGMGTIGTLLAMFLRDAGYKDILAIGNKTFQKETWIKLGFSEENFIDSKSIDVSEWIMQRTSGQGVSTFFECIGKSETISQVVDLTKPAGAICLVGNPYGDVNLSQAIYWKILRNQLKVTGTWNSSFTQDKTDDWHYVLDRVATGNIRPEELITHRFAIEDLEKGFLLMRDKSEDYIKVMMI